jgi:hypothetical protein
MRVRAGNDFNHVAVLNQGSQRHHAPVHARACTRVTDFRVNHVSEIDGRGAPRQLNYLAHRRERIDVFGIEVELQ